MASSCFVRMDQNVAGCINLAFLFQSIHGVQMSWPQHLPSPNPLPTYGCLVLHINFSNILTLKIANTVSSSVSKHQQLRPCSQGYGDIGENCISLAKRRKSVYITNECQPRACVNLSIIVPSSPLIRQTNDTIDVASV